MFGTVTVMQTQAIEWRSLSLTLSVSGFGVFWVSDDTADTQILLSNSPGVSAPEFLVAERSMNDQERSRTMLIWHMMRCFDASCSLWGFGTEIKDETWTKSNGGTNVLNWKSWHLFKLKKRLSACQFVFYFHQDPKFTLWILTFYLCESFSRIMLTLLPKHPVSFTSNITNYLTDVKCTYKSLCQRMCADVSLDTPVPQLTDIIQHQN